MPDERFIQDAFCNPERILRLLRNEGIRPDWDFRQNTSGLPDDVVNQEFSFVVDNEGGRADVIATFNNRQKLMICEVKSGAVGDGEVEQLRWYVDGWNSRNVQIVDDTISSAQEVIGVLLAEEFLPIKQEHLVRENIFFVRFKFDGNSFPFEVVTPTADTECGEPVQTPVRRQKQSWLWQLGDKTNAFDDTVRSRFEAWSNFLLPDGDPRVQWVFPNVKGGHVWMSYKSARLMCLFPRTRTFHGHFGHGGISGEFTETDDTESFKRDVYAMLDAVDDEYQSEIPNGFCWDTCK